MIEKVKILIFISVATLFVGCGTTQEDIDVDNDERNIYDMWDYMTPTDSFQVEYDIYVDGQKDDYIVEDIRVLNDSWVKRESDDGVTSLRRRRDSIELREPDGTEIEVQRFVKIGDRGIFQSSSSIGNCTLDDFYRRITLKGIEFYKVIHVICKKRGTTNEFYYGFDEGIVATYSDDNREIVELIKIDERELNR